jgi:hypothetical protein
MQICMLFDNMKQGLDYIKQHMGDDTVICPKKYLGRDGMWITPKGAAEQELDYDGEGDVAAHFWTRYYNGCGGASPFFLTEFPTATPLLVWDMD